MNPTTRSTGQTGFEPDQVAVAAQNATPDADDSVEATASTRQATPRRRVALVVFGDVTPEADPPWYVAQHALRAALRAAARDGEHTIRLPHDPTNTAFRVRFHEVWDLATASVNGYLAVEPTDRAYRWLEDK